jgi:hypothetical protein
VQSWHQTSKDDYQAPYTVWFVHAGRLYRFGAENRGDWYDVEAVHRAINSALATAGQRERFIALESEGQIAAFVFADPERFIPVAKKYGLPLSDDPDSAMRKGREYERKVIDGR